jgi:hypothetical protein
MPPFPNSYGAGAIERRKTRKAGGAPESLLESVSQSQKSGLAPSTAGEETSMSVR